MGGFMDFMFGSEPETKFGTMSTLDPQQSGLFNQLAEILSGQVGSGVPSYPGTYTPGPSSTQNQIFALVKSLLGGTGPLQQEGMGTLESLMEPYSDVKARNYWETAVKKPGLETWQKDIVPQLMEQFAAYDAAGSGPAMKAVAESGRRLDTDMSSQLEKILMEYENEYKNRSLDASKVGLSYPEMLLSATLPAATSQRQITAEQLQEPYQDWLYSQPYNNPWLKYLMPMLDMNTFENTAVQQGGQQGILSDLLGAGATLGSAWLKPSTFLLNPWA